MKAPLKIFIVILFFCIKEAHCYQTHDANQRKEFLKIEKSIQSEKVKSLSDFKHLVSYPLYPDLYSSFLIKKNASLDFNKLEHFEKKFGAIPPYWALLKHWMRHNAKMENWETLSQLNVYLPFEDLQCIQAQAHLHTHQFTKLQYIQSKWKHGVPPLVGSCMPLLKKIPVKTLENFLQNHLGSIDPALLKKEILPLVSLNAQKLLNIYLHILKHPIPSRFVERAHLWPRHPLRGAVLEVACQNLAKQSINDTLKSWSYLKKTALMSPKEMASAQKAIAIFLAKKNHPSAFNWLSSLPPEYMDGEMSELYLRAALKKMRWSDIIHRFSLLPPHLQNEAKFQYWLARSYGMLGNKQKSIQIYLKIVDQRNVYGFLAAEYLKIPPKSFSQLPAVNEKTGASMRKALWIQRRKEFIALGKNAEAFKEWKYATDLMQDPELLKAAYALHQEGDYYLAIKTLSKTKDQNCIHLQFPTPHYQHVSRAAKLNMISPAWIYAITRQESAFQKNAISKAGARGLMQLMPGTAQDVALKKQTPLRSLQDLYSTPLNLHLGAAYLQELHRIMNGHFLLVTAAYNAGPNRIKTWLPESPVPGDLWMETIPFTETRKYVNNVLTYTKIYSELLGKPTALNLLIHPVQKPRAVFSYTSRLSKKG